VFLVGPPTLRRNRRQFETLHGRLCVTSQLSLIRSGLFASSAVWLCMAWCLRTWCLRTGCFNTGLYGHSRTRLRNPLNCLLWPL
jgi:hypothetical protein